MYVAICAARSSKRLSSVRSSGMKAEGKKAEQANKNVSRFLPRGKCLNLRKAHIYERNKKAK